LLRLVQDSFENLDRNCSACGFFNGVQTESRAHRQAMIACSTGRIKVAPILVTLTVLGGLWRAASVRFNVWPHGDVVIDAAIAESVAWSGRLLVPFVDVRYYPIDRFGFGYPPDQHPPLWPLLGAALVWLVGDGYTALKLVSLLIGVALIPLTYVAMKRYVGAGPALFASALTAGSFPMVDFSGNGSLWSLLAASYLGWLWALPGDASDTAASRRRWALVGLIMGLGYLTNYPAVVLPVALAALHVVRHGRHLLRPKLLAGPAISAVVMLVVISPWLIYNVALFGGPFWSQPFQRTLAGGSRQVEYVVVDGEAVKRNLPATGDRLAGLRERAVDLYGNVGFLVKQSLVLTPILGGLFLVGLLLLVPLLGWRKVPLTPQLPLPHAGEGGQRGEGVLRHADIHGGEQRAVRAEGRRAERDGKLDTMPMPVPVAVLALVHLALIIWWPTTKFRYLIPLLPLVFGIGAWALWQLRPPELRARLAAVTLAACLFTNVWTMLSIPSRTYYYNGGLIGDNFGQQGERIFMDEARQFRLAADAILAHGPGVILADHILAPFTRMPLVVNSTGYPPEVVEHLVRKYGVRYVVIDVPHASLYDYLGPTTIWSNDRLVVLEIPRR
jgi:4-amino-4-deoxy-L-arabinose transferase-like glycosyltransferase